MMAIDYARVVLTEKNRIKYLLPWLGVQPTRVEELRGEVDVHVTEKEQDVAAPPEAGSDVQPLSPGEFSIQLDEGEVPEIGSSREWWEQKVSGCHSPPHHLGGQGS